MAVSINPRQTLRRHEKLFYTLKPDLMAHRHPCRRGLGKVGGALVAFEGGKFLIGHHGPFGTKSQESLHPPIAILAFKTGRFPEPNQGQSKYYTVIGLAWPATTGGMKKVSTIHRREIPGSRSPQFACRFKCRATRPIYQAYTQPLIATLAETGCPDRSIHPERGEIKVEDRLFLHPLVAVLFA